MARNPIDDTALAVLKALQTGARQTNAEIAEQLSVVPSTISKKIAALEAAGVIREYRAIIDTNPSSSYNKIQCIEFALISLESHDKTRAANFVEALKTFREVTEIHMVAALGDYLVKIMTKNQAHYRALVSKLGELDNFGKIQTIAVIDTILDREPNVDIAYGDGNSKPE